MTFFKYMRYHFPSTNTEPCMEQILIDDVTLARGWQGVWVIHIDDVRGVCDGDVSRRALNYILRQ